MQVIQIQLIWHKKNVNCIGKNIASDHSIAI